MSKCIQYFIAMMFILFLEGLEYRYILINLHRNEKPVLFGTTDYSLNIPHEMDVDTFPKARTISPG